MKTILSTGLQRIVECRNLTVAVHQTDASGTYSRSLSERSIVTNACFLNVFIALEEFLEASFVHYMTGRMSTSRWRPEKFARNLNTDHAHRMLIGNTRFVDWSTPDTVLKLADLYFKDGEPFRTALASSHTHLQQMKTVRNSTAHSSTTTKIALDSLFTRWTGTALVGQTAYDVLMAAEHTTAQTFYGTSEQVVTAVMRNIGDRA